MVIGKIIKSNAHHDYVCQIYAAGEVERPPEPVDYRFSTFVGIQMDNGRSLIGLIYDTILLNPAHPAISLVSAFGTGCSGSTAPPVS